MRNKAVFSGIALSLALIGVSVLLSLVVALLSSSDVVYLSSYIGLMITGGLLAGGFFAGYVNGRNGWVSGGATGLVLCLLGLVFSNMLLPRHISLGELTLALVPGTFLAALAGVCGVNVSRAKKKKQKNSLLKLQQKCLK